MSFHNACVLEIDGKTRKKKGVFIPIEDNNFYVSTDTDGNVKAVYVDFFVNEKEQPGNYGETHSFKQSISKSARDKMTLSELKNIPYLGSMKPYNKNGNKKQNSYSTSAASDSQNVKPNIEVNDLPF